MLDCAKVSFIFQGPIASAGAVEFLEGSIERIRSKCPGAEVVVASWTGQLGESVKGADVLKLLADPGALPPERVRESLFKFRNANTKRMLYSTCEGLRAATRKYCVKLRTDSRVDATKLLARLSADLERDLPADRFQQRVWVGNLFSRNPRRSALLFHLSDIFLVGLRTDLLGLFGAAWDWVRELETGGGKIPWLCPEQFLWLPTLRGETGVSLSHGFDFGVRQVRQYEWAVLENIFVLAASDVGLAFSKEFGTTIEDCYRPEEIFRDAASLRRAPVKHAIRLVGESFFRNILARILLLIFGVKSKMVRLFHRRKPTDARAS